MRAACRYVDAVYQFQDMHLCYSINFIPGSHCLNKDCGLNNVAGGNLHESLFQETSLTRFSVAR